MKRLTKALIGVLMGTTALCSVAALTACEHEHDWATDYTVDKAATCTEDGSKSIHCNGCDETKDVTKIPAGHTWADGYTIDTPATCTTDGSKSIHCDNCDETKDVTVIPAAHSWAVDFTVDTPATCLGEGSKSIHCTVDGCDETKDVTPIPPNGHDFEDEYTIDEEPTCTVKGSKSYHCKNCEASDGAVFVDELDHAAGDWTVEDQNLPSLTSGGKATVYCTREGCDELVAEHDLPALTSEDYAFEVVTPSTCTMTGEATYVYNKDGVTVTFTGGLELEPHQYGETLDLTDKTTGDIIGKTCGVCGSPDIDNSYIYMGDDIKGTDKVNEIEVDNYYFDVTGNGTIWLKLAFTSLGKYEINFNHLLDTTKVYVDQILYDGDTNKKVAYVARGGAPILDAYANVATIEHTANNLQTLKFTFDACDKAHKNHYVKIRITSVSNTGSIAFTAGVNFEPAPAPKIVAGTALTVDILSGGEKALSKIQVDDSIATGTYTMTIKLTGGNLRNAYLLMQVGGNPTYDDITFEGSTYEGTGVAFIPGQFHTKHPETYTGTSTYQAVYTVTTTLTAGDMIYFATTGFTTGTISVTLTAA